MSKRHLIYFIVYYLNFLVKSVLVTVLILCVRLDCLLLEIHLFFYIINWWLLDSLVGLLGSRVDIWSILKFAFNILREWALGVYVIHNLHLVLALDKSIVEVVSNWFKLGQLVQGGALV